MQYGKLYVPLFYTHWIQAAWLFMCWQAATINRQASLLRQHLFHQGLPTFLYPLGCLAKHKFSCSAGSFQYNYIWEDLSLRKVQASSFMHHFHWSIEQKQQPGAHTHLLPLHQQFLNYSIISHANSLLSGLFLLLRPLNDNRRNTDALLLLAGLD